MPDAEDAADPAREGHHRGVHKKRRLQVSCGVIFSLVEVVVPRGSSQNSQGDLSAGFTLSVP